MKNSIVFLGLTVLAAVSTPPANAGHREWATVGKVLTGVAVVHAVSHAVAAPCVTYVPAPAPVIYVPAPAPAYVLAPAPLCVASPAPVVVYPPPYCPPPRRVIKHRHIPLPAVHVSFGFGHHHRRSHRH